MQRVSNLQKIFNFFIKQFSLFQDTEAQKELSASNDDLSENNSTKVSSRMWFKHVDKLCSTGVVTDTKLFFRRKIFLATCLRSCRNQQRALLQTRYCDVIQLIEFPVMEGVVDIYNYCSPVLIQELEVSSENELFGSCENLSDSTAPKVQSFSLFFCLVAAAVVMSTLTGHKDGIV